MNILMQIFQNFSKLFEKKKGILELSPVYLTKTKSHIFLFKS